MNFDEPASPFGKYPPVSEEFRLRGGGISLKDFRHDHAFDQDHLVVGLLTAA